MPRHHACPIRPATNARFAAIRPKRPLRDLLTDYKTVCATCSPLGLAGGCHAWRDDDRSGRPKQLADGDIARARRRCAVQDQQALSPEVRGPFWRLRADSKSNPDALRRSCADGDLPAPWAFYPAVIGEINRRIDELDQVSRRDGRYGRLYARRWRAA